MATTSPTIITLDDDVKIVEPAFNDSGVIAVTDITRDASTPIYQDTLVEPDKDLLGGLILSPSGLLLRQYIEGEGFGDHHIEVYDNWIFRTSYNNVYSRMLQFPDGRTVCFENLKIFHPRYTRDGKVLPLTPKLAREQGVTYGGDWHVDVVMHRGTSTGPEIDRLQAVCIGTVPTMLKSLNCILHGKTPRELALYGEDPKDPGGYFIVSGNEKVALLQEQLTVNKIFLMNMDSKGSTVARMTANTPRGTALIELALDKKTRTVIKIRFPSMRGVKQGEKYKSINVLRIFRLFGVTEIEDIRNLVSLFMKPDRIKKSMFKLTRNLVDFIMFPDDVEIMAAKMDKTKNTPAEKRKDVFRVLDTDLFPHLNNLSGPDNETVPEKEVRIITAKKYLLAIMISRFLEHLAGYRALDNRDSWSNKRVEGAGRMMEQLFRNAWRKTLGIVQASIETGAIKDLGGVVEKIRYSVITDTFHDSFVTSNWGVKGTQMKNNVAQTLVRDSVVATFAHINTVDVGISRTDRQQSLRMVQNDQWGFICPASTPEGENTGILKNLSITAKVALERSDTDIIRLLIGDVGKGVLPRVSMDLKKREEWPDKVIVNGKFLGWCVAEETRVFLVNLRREGSLPPDMSVIKENDWLYVDIGPSRLVRPLLIVDDDQQLAIDRLKSRGQPNHTLLINGSMEYISSWEQEYIKVAISTDVISKRLDMIEDANETYRVAVAQLLAVQRGEKIEIEIGDETVEMTEEEAKARIESTTDALDKLEKNKPYTHCELDPLAILGVSAALIPWPNHNQAPRNTYQVNMGKQALGIYHSNHLNRYDGKTKILAFPNRPTVETEMYNVIGLDDRGPGENVVVMFGAFPYTEEDSFIVKKEFLDNGGFRIYKYLTYKTIVKHSGGVTEELTKPEPRPGEPAERYKYIQMFEKGNPNNGLPMIGAPLKQGDCAIGKLQHVPATKDLRNESVILRVGDEGVVDKVIVTSDNKTTVVVVKLRVMRVPQEGDKFAPRNAQKGTVGLVMSDIDMPSTEEGITPDFIVNPHCFTADTPVLLKNGTSRRLKSMSYNGGDKVFALYKQQYRFVTAKTMGYESKGVKKIVELTFSDGRKIRCTPDHRFPIIEMKNGMVIKRDVEAKEIKDNMVVVAGMKGVLDEKTEEEKDWKNDGEEYCFDMETGREKALAYARMIGYMWETSGDEIWVRSHIDAELVIDDIKVITEKTVSVMKHYTDEGIATMIIGLPDKLVKCMEKEDKEGGWPKFVLDDKCPKALIREFLGGLFGARGGAPGLDGDDKMMGQTMIMESKEGSEKVIELLNRVGVKGYENIELMGYGGKMTYVVKINKGEEFGDKVGYRYNIKKMYMQEGYQSCMGYMRESKGNKMSDKEYLIDIEGYEWYNEQVKKNVWQDSISLPYYKLRVIKVEEAGEEEVYDLGVFGAHTLTVNGIAANNCIPSRMTIEYPMELLAAKHGAMRAKHVNGGAFQPFHMNEYRETMKEYGKHEFGYEKMRSGTSGKPLQVIINCGPVFMQALKHHVKDKVQVRSTGQVKPMTRQPPKGRGNRGGLRFGEMERDAAISHGASAFLRERLMFVSDAYQTAFCKTCGTFAINDAATRRYKPCRLCDDDENFGRCTIPYAYKLLIHLLAAAGENLRPEFITSEEHVDKLFRMRSMEGTEVADVQTLLEEADEGLIEEQEEFADEGEDTDFAEVFE